MRRTFETLSTWTFRIAVLSMLGFAALQIRREQSRPGKAELQDAKYLEHMEEYIKREHASSAAAKTANRPSLRTIQCPNQKFGR
jgi:hypothetical protein